MNPETFIHAGPLTAVTVDRCSWRWSFEDVHLRCDDTPLPLEDLCVHHFIAAAHKRADDEAAARLRQAPFSPQWRRWPATPVTEKDSAK